MTLDEWKQNLFANMDPEFNPFSMVNTITTSIAFKETEQLHVVSDGSALEDSMSFGWVLALPDGTILVNCLGPAIGFMESPYRSEGHGVLSMVRFLYRLQTFCRPSHFAATRSTQARPCSKVLFDGLECWLTNEPQLDQADYPPKGQTSYYRSKHVRMATHLQGLDGEVIGGCTGRPLK